MRWGIRFVLLAVALGLVMPVSAAGFGALSSFGEFGSGAGQLDSPSQIAVALDGDLYVADSGNDRVSVYAGDGTFLRSLTGQMDKPADVALDRGGRAFVADSGNGQIDVFSAAGAPLPDFGDGELLGPRGVAVDGSTVYVADSGNDRIAVFTTGGEFLYSFMVPSPQDVIVGEDGRLYVADPEKERVDVFTKQGAELGFFGETGPGALATPVALAADGAGGLYVADEAAGRLERFAGNGGFLGGVVATPNIAGVGVGCGGNVFAVERDASIARVQRFGEPGTPAPPCVSTVEPIDTPGAKLPSNRFHFAGVRLNRSNGFATLLMRLPGPGQLKLTGRGFRRLSRSARQATTIQLPIKPKVRLRHFLKRHGKGRIRAVVTFTPTGGIPRTQEKVIVLRRHRA